MSSCACPLPVEEGSISLRAWWSRAALLGLLVLSTCATAAASGITRDAVERGVASELRVAAKPDRTSASARVWQEWDAASSPDRIPSIQPWAGPGGVVVVGPSNLGVWEIRNFDASANAELGANTTSSGTDGDFTAGPGTPPSGAGSFSQVVGTNGSDNQRLVTNTFNGLPLTSLAELSYSTYVTAFGTGGQATYIQLFVDFNNNGTHDDILFFEPKWQTGAYAGNPVPNQGTLVTGTWQPWNAKTGGWWSLNAFTFGPPLVTLTNYIAAHPGAKLATNLPAFRLVGGSGAPAWNGFRGSVDRLKVNGTIYDFELVAPPPAGVLTSIATSCAPLGWSPSLVGSGTAAITAAFPRSGNGSLALGTTGAGDEANFVRTNPGVDLLTTLTGLQVELYRAAASTAPGAAAPVVRLYVDNGNATNRYSYLVWEPFRNGIPVFPTNTWTNYDLLKGYFWQFAFKTAPPNRTIDLYTRTLADWVVAGTVTDGGGDVSNEVGPNARVLGYEIRAASGVTGTLSAAADLFTIGFGNAARAQFNFESTVATTTALGVDPAKSVCGSKVTLTATVTAATATGSVQFYDGATPLGAAVPTVGGVAQLSLGSGVTVGPHSFTASYAGDACHVASASSAVSHEANIIPVTLSLGALPSPSVCSQPVTLTATASPAGASGTVQFIDVPAGPAVSLFGTGTPSGTTHVADPSAYTLGVKFFSDVPGLVTHVRFYKDAANNGAHTVGLWKSDGTLLSSAPVAPEAVSGWKDVALPSPVLIAAGATYVAGVHTTTGYAEQLNFFTSAYNQPPLHAPAQSGGNPNGVFNAGASLAFPATAGSAANYSVDVAFVPGASLGSVALAAGSAQLATSSFAVGLHDFFALYGGDACYTAAVAPGIKHTVGLAPVSVALTSSVAKTECGGKLDLTAMLTPGAATGQVEFFDGVVSLGTVTVAAGQATLSLTALAVGNHTLTVKYLGDACYDDATSPGLAHEVEKAPVFVTLGSDAAKTLCTGPVLFTANVSPSTATGTVQFYAGFVPLGLQPLVGGTASLSTSALAVGGHSITAIYNGDDCYTTGTSSALAHQVNLAATTTSLSADLAKSSCGDKVTLTATVSPAAAGGTVQFFDGATLLGTQPLLAGVAALSTSALGTGARSLTAVYSGDACYGGGASSALAHQVHALPSATTLLADLGKTLCGAPVTLTATLSPGSATGSVEFFQAATSKASLFPGDPTPATFYDDGLITVGMKFYADVPGMITRVRFYKHADNDGPFTVALWSGGGTLLSSASWSTGPDQGWQDVELPAPVPVLANQRYVVGYHTTALHAQDLGLDSPFSAGGVHDAPLHAPADAVSDRNGVFSPGAALTFPTLFNNASNFFVDVGFATGVSLGSAPIVAGASSLPVSSLPIGAHTLFALYGGAGCLGGSASAALEHTVSPVVTSAALEVKPPASGCIAPSTLEATIAPAAATGSVEFFDVFGVAPSYLFGSNPTPGNPYATDPSGAVTVGVRFYADVPGAVTSVRYYKDAANTGPHTVGLWTAGGTLLQSAPASGATASGWQEVTFASPVPIAANQTYVAGYHSATGYSQDVNFFTAALDQPPLHAPAEAPGAPNGVYAYGAALTFPSNGVLASNYSVDVGFAAGTSLGSAPLVAGVASIASTLAAGTHPLFIRYGGDACHLASLSVKTPHVVALPVPALSLDSSPAAVACGGKLTLTATLPATATGTVAFFDGATPIGTGALAGGVATLSLTTLAVGGHSFTAQYSGDLCLAPAASAPLARDVDLALPFVALGADFAKTTCGGKVSLTATMTPATATGSVEFFDGLTSLGSYALVGGVATLSETDLLAGAHSLTAAYGGDACFATASSAPLAHQVHAAATTVTLASDVGTTTCGGKVTITATVSPVTATGTVEFFDGATSLGSTAVVAGQAVLSASGLAVGDHDLTATYSGDACFAIGTSAALDHKVELAPTTTTLAADLGKTLCGGTVTLTATVLPATAGGTVEFFDGVASLGTAPVVAGVATLPVASLGAGAHSLTATYGGDACFATSGSSALAHQVNPGPTTLLLASDSPSACGDAAQFTATVAPAEATGTVEFFQVTGAPKARLFPGDPTPVNPFYGAAPPLTVGIKFTADVPGLVTSIRFYKDPANSGAHTVELWSAAGTLLGSAPSAAGAPYGWHEVPLTAPVPIAANQVYVAAYHTESGFSADQNVLTAPVNQAPLHAPAETPTAPNGVYVYGPAGTFPSGGYFASMYYVDLGFAPGASLGSAPLAAGVATLPVPALPVGSLEVFAAYGGAACFATSASAIVEHEVVPGPSVTTLISGPNPSACTAPATLTASVSPAAATGTVEFFESLPGGKVGLFTSAPDPGPGDFYHDGNLTIGLKFFSEVPGLVTSVRFFRDSRNAGPFTVGLWHDDGTLLASAPWSGGPASGWQDVPLAAPVFIVANQRYRAGVHTTSYHPQVLPGALATEVIAAPLHAPADAVGDPNGVYTTGASLAFPATGNQASNFYVDVGFAPAASLGSGPLVAASAGIPVSSLALGKHELFAVYSGDACVAGGMSSIHSHTVELAPTSLAFAGDAATTFCGGKLTVTATMTPGTVTGNVEFFDGLVSLGNVAIGAGTASLSLTSLTPGSHALSAKYLGSACHATSENGITQPVSPAPTTLGIAANEAKTSCEGKLEITATVSPASATGSVEFFDGAASLGTAAIASGVATLSIASLPVGPHSLGASYAGDACRAGSAATTLPHTVSLAATTVALGTSPAPSACGAEVTLTATVSPATASGTVEFFDGATSLGSAPVTAGVASLSLSSLAAGSHSLTAVYSGDLCFATATAPATVHTVLSLPTTLALATDASKTACDASFALTATVSPGTATGTVEFFSGPIASKGGLFPGDPTPGNYSPYAGDLTIAVRFTSDVAGWATSVRFYKDALNTGAHSVELWSAGGTLLGSAPSSGETASGWQTVALPFPVPIAAGQDYLAAYHTVVGFSYDPNYFLSPLNVPPLHAPAETPTAPNGAYAFAPAGTFPTGSYYASNYYVDVGFAPGVSLGTAPVAAGVATLPVSGLAIGTHQLFAHYGGGGCDGGSVSARLTHDVSAVPTSLSLAGLPAPGTCQAPVSLEATITPATAAGSVAFFDAGGPTSHLFGLDPTPGNPHNNDANPATVGVRFTADVLGAVTSVRFYKALGNSGTHSVGLWKADGTPLANAPSNSETPSGWQEVTLPAPVLLEPNQPYVAGVHTTSGYAQDLNFFSVPLDQPPLHAPADGGPSAPNGCYVYGAALAFPGTGYNSANYYVDVGFSTGVALGTAPLVAGVATLPVPPLTVGSHTLFATYVGDGCRAASHSPQLVYDVQRIVTTVVVTAGPNPVKEDNKVLLTATVTPPGATGTVEFLEGVTKLGDGVLAGGVATLSLTTLSTGKHMIHAVYSGDDCHADGTSAPISVEVVVDAPPTATVVSPNGNEVLPVGVPAKLSWTTDDDNGVVSVDLYVSRNGLLGPWETIALNEPDDGTYTWTVPGPGSNLGPSPVYSSYFRVVAKDALGQTGTDESDITFAIYDLATPALLTMFQLEPARGGIELRWRLADGMFRETRVERGAGSSGPWVEATVERSEESGVSIALDRDAGAGRDYWYRLVATFEDGGTVAFGPWNGRAEARIERLELARVWPNPSRGVTQLEFTVPEPARVRLSVLDLQGREMAVLADGDYHPGRHQAAWSGSDGRGRARPGIYFIRLASGGRTQTRRIVIE